MTKANAVVVHPPPLWRSVWRSMREPDWLLSEVLTFFEEDGDDIHGLWLLAIDDELDSLRLHLEQSFAVSVDYARRIAMVHSMWSVLLKLECVGSVLRRVKSQCMGEKTVDRVLTELDRLQVPAHADRSAVLRAVEWPSVCNGPALTYQGPRKHYFSAGRYEVHFCQGALRFVLYAAARRGLLESVVWLHEVACYNQLVALKCAAQHGHDHVVDWLLDHPHSGITVDSRSQDDGQLGVAAWRDSSDFYCTMHKTWGFHTSYGRYEPACAAASCGDVDGLTLLSGHKLFGGLTDSVARSAVSSGQREVLVFLLEHCRQALANQSVLSCAIQHRRLDIVQWLVSNDCCAIDEGRLWQAAESEQLEMLQWLLERFDGRAAMEARIASAMVGGHRILGWLEDERGLELTSIPDDKVGAVCRDFVLTKRIVTRRIARGAFSADEVSGLFSAAIKADNVELLRWLVDDLSLWYPYAFHEASNGSNPETLSFVYEAARVRSSSLVVAHREGGPIHLDTLEWLLDHGFRSGFLGREALSGIAIDEREYARSQQEVGYHASPPQMRRQREVLCRVIDVYDPEYLRQIKWLPRWAARRGKLKALQRLAEIRHERAFTRKVFDRLMFQSGSEEAMYWYLQRRPEWFTSLVLVWAVTHGKRGLLQWIFVTFLPSRDNVEQEVELVTLRKCVRTALCVAAKLDRRDIARLLQQWTPMARDPSLWRGIDEHFRISCLLELKARQPFGK